MKTQLSTSNSVKKSAEKPNQNYFRFHMPHIHLASLYGDDWFALKAEAIAMVHDQRLAISEEHTSQMLELIQQNTQLTEITKQLSERIELLTIEMHARILREKTR